MGGTGDDESRLTGRRQTGRQADRPTDTRILRATNRPVATVTRLQSGERFLSIARSCSSSSLALVSFVSLSSPLSLSLSSYSSSSFPHFLFLYLLPSLHNRNLHSSPLPATLTTMRQPWLAIVVLALASKSVLASSQDSTADQENGVFSGRASIRALEAGSTDMMFSPTGMTLANPLLAAAPRRPEDCPPCFNCLLDAFPCSHFAPCNPYDGRCTCPPGFAGDNCSVPGNENENKVVDSSWGLLERNKNADLGSITRLSL